MQWLTISFILAYVLGSVPSAVWVGKALSGTDVREHGSKNAGAANTFRVLGWKIGSIVLIMDILKGYIAVGMLTLLPHEFSSSQLYTFKVIAGFLAVIGHIYSVFLKFRGGKGVAVSLGIVLAIAPAPALMAFGVYLALFFSTHYTSVGSMLGGLSFPVFTLIKFGVEYPALNIFSVVVALLLIYTHRENIQRLRQGNERKTYLKKSKNKTQTPQPSST